MPRIDEKNDDIRLNINKYKQPDSNLTCYQKDVLDTRSKHHKGNPHDVTAWEDFMKELDNDITAILKKTE